MRNHKSRLIVMVAVLLVGATAVGVALAQTSDSFDLSWNVLGGGSDSGASDSFALGSTVGQNAPGTSASDGFQLDAGFWPGAAASGSGPVEPPAPTPEAFVFGDVDCDDDVDAVDSLKELRWVAGLSVSQTEPCPDIGSEVASLFGEVDCDDDVDAVDSLKLLRFVAGLSVSQEAGCPVIGV